MYQTNTFCTFTRSYEIKSALQELLPNASSEEIDSALSNGNAEKAAQHLLGLCLLCKASYGTHI